MEQLREWRGGRTLEEAGELLGVSAVQVHRYETGARKIPGERVSEVESITGISRHTLRPDIFGPERPAPSNEAAA